MNQNQTSEVRTARFIVFLLTPFATPNMVLTSSCHSNNITVGSTKKTRTKVLNKSLEGAIKVSNRNNLAV